MSWLVAALYDPTLYLAERACLSAWRKELLSNMEGSILELGAGSGHNLPYYARVGEEAWLCEPDPSMRQKLRRRLAPLGDRFHVSEAKGELLPFVAGRFDAVVCTLVLCTVTDVAATLAEAHRVLRPGGRLLLIEHIAAPAGTSRRRWQQRLSPLWEKVAGGCRLTRDPRVALLSGGFVPQSVLESEMTMAPGFIASVIRGTWVRE